MTMLGVVRFLDHFCDLYGNRLSRSERRQSDAVLKSVLRTFSLQWMPSETRTRCDSTTILFTEAWLQARSLLQDALHLLSYRALYAILLFDGISMPLKVSKSIEAHEFLDAGLENLCHLHDMVEEYCSNISSSSTYRALLEASLQIVRWGGYIRDTGAALTADRPCKLPDIPKHTKEIGDLNDGLDVLPIILDHGFDNEVPEICRKAFAEAFFVWREIIHLKASAKYLDELPQETTEAVISVRAAVEAFNQQFRPFMVHCTDKIGSLSVGSKIHFVSFAIVWDLGVLVLAESAKPLVTICESSRSAMRAYQQEAINSILHTVKAVLSLPKEEAFNLHNGMSADLPITSYHITPNLMAMTLRKAIQHVIESQLSMNLNSDQTDGRIQATPSGNGWEQSIDILMKGLVSLNATVGGAEAAGNHCKS
ncbi:hypothetical protein BDV59DRAFT_3161 [Aspergillus ambiguus]|uniref:uncharacterized protein n=1 Tax=Aspergillus ambiguus TaxID=176160 RepID=UPI003CCD51AC